MNRPVYTRMAELLRRERQSAAEPKFRIQPTQAVSKMLSQVTRRRPVPPPSAPRTNAKITFS